MTNTCYAKHISHIGGLHMKTNIVERMIEETVRDMLGWKHIKEGEYITIHADTIAKRYDKDVGFIYKNILKYLLYLGNTPSIEKTSKGISINWHIRDIQTNEEEKSVSVLWNGDYIENFTGKFKKGDYRNVPNNIALLPAPRASCLEILSAELYRITDENIYKNVYYFDLMLGELRRYTGTEDKYKNINLFKKNILDPCMEDLKNKGYNIGYIPMKMGGKTNVIRVFNKDKVKKGVSIEKNVFKIVDLNIYGEVFNGN